MGSLRWFYFLRYKFKFFFKKIWVYVYFDLFIFFIFVNLKERYLNIYFGNLYFLFKRIKGNRVVGNGSNCGMCYFGVFKVNYSLLEGI